MDIGQNKTENRPSKELKKKAEKRSFVSHPSKM